MNITTTFKWLTMLAGVFLTITGAALTGGYIWEAVIQRLGDPDQSLLFWYLPILFAGVLLFSCGLFISIWAGRKIFSIKRNR